MSSCVSHDLPTLEVEPHQAADAVRSALHTVLFCRLLGAVRPLDALAESLGSSRGCGQEDAEGEDFVFATCGDRAVAAAVDERAAALGAWALTSLPPPPPPPSPPPSSSATVVLSLREHSSSSSPSPSSSPWETWNLPIRVSASPPRREGEEEQRNLPPLLLRGAEGVRSLLLSIASRAAARTSHIPPVLTASVVTFPFEIRFEGAAAAAGFSSSSSSSSSSTQIRNQRQQQRSGLNPPPRSSPSPSPSPSPSAGSVLRGGLGAVKRLLQAAPPPPVLGPPSQQGLLLLPPPLSIYPSAPAPAPASAPSPAPAPLATALSAPPSSEENGDEEGRGRRRHHNFLRFSHRLFAKATAVLRRAATALVSCVGIGGKETSAGFLARRRQQQQQHQLRRLSLASSSSSAAAEETGAAPPQLQLHSSAAPETATEAMQSDPSSSAAAAAAAAAAAVAALSAARDAAAALLAGRGALDDFERLRSRASKTAPLACDAALHPENRRKNRYNDVLAPDHSRVVLKSSLEEVAASGVEGEGAGATANEQQQLSPPSSSPSPSSIKGGYINASLLSSRPGELPAWSYVATQGPLSSTVADFWQLVAQLRSPAVVSLTRSEERGVEKCARYLPAMAYGDKASTQEGEEGEEGLLHSAVFGGIRVSCGRARAAGAGLVARHVAVEIVSTSTSSSLSSSSTPFRHSLLHLHVDDWPDHGAPASSASLRAAAAAMRGAVDEANARASEREKIVVGPPVVHCSAGIGRTGTLVAVDIAARRLRAAVEGSTSSSSTTLPPGSSSYSPSAAAAAARAVAVRRVVRRLRDARPGMVQTPGQYAAVVAAVRDEAAALMEGLMSTTTTEAKEASPLPVPLGGLLSDEGSGEDD